MLYLTEGDYINAGLSALSIIPGADAFTKTGKASKVLGNGIVESGLKHLDNVADGIKKLVKKADDAIDLEKHLPKKLLTEEAEAFAKKADKVADDVVEDAAKAIKSGTSTLAQYGDDFGKIGTYIENPNIKVDWTQYAEHAAERMQQRGMTQEMVNNIVENGKVLSQNNGNKFAYITQEGVAIVSKEGKLITAWSSADFDSSMLEIISKLFGE